MADAKNNASTSRHLIDPELAPALDMFPAFELNAAMLGQMREMMSTGLMQIAQAPLPPSLKREEIFIPGNPKVRALVYTPTAASGPRPALLHIHGGGYLMGVPEMNEMNNRRLAAAADCVIVSVDYRLAPETPHPGPVEDCYTALKWLHANAKQLNVDNTRIAVAGESAGGGLAAALCLLARDRGEVSICLQMLGAPMIDDRTATTRAVPDHIGEFVWTRAANHFGWKSLLGREPGGADTPAYAAAARAKEVAGLPPTFMYVGALDLFVQEDIEYARRLVDAGVPTELHVYAGAFHGFELAAESEPVKAMMRAQETALRRAFARA